MAPGGVATHRFATYVSLVLAAAGNQCVSAHNHTVGGDNEDDSLSKTWWYVVIFGGGAIPVIIFMLLSAKEEIHHRRIDRIEREMEEQIAKARSQDLIEFFSRSRDDIKVPTWKANTLSSKEEMIKKDEDAAGSSSGQRKSTISSLGSPGEVIEIGQHNSPYRGDQRGGAAAPMDDYDDDLLAPADGKRRSVSISWSDLNDQLDENGDVREKRGSTGGVGGAAAAAGPGNKVPAAAVATSSQLLEANRVKVELEAKLAEAEAANTGLQKEIQQQKLNATRSKLEAERLKLQLQGVDEDSQSSASAYAQARLAHINARRIGSETRVIPNVIDDDDDDDD